MKSLNKFIDSIQGYINRPVKPEKGYGLWAESYDDEKDNLILDMGKALLGILLENIELENQVLLDEGCGTGRNWPLILSGNPLKIIGCDISVEMISKLKSKFPGAETHLISGTKFPSISAGSIDTVFCLLVIAHIKNIDNLFNAWSKYLNNYGKIVITDLHPEVLKAGGKRIFKYKNRHIHIKNYVHSIEKIKRICRKYDLVVEELIEKKITPDLKEYYVKRNARHVYEKFEGLSLIYGMKIGRQNAA